MIEWLRRHNSTPTNPSQMKRMDLQNQGWRFIYFWGCTCNPNFETCIPNPSECNPNIKNEFKRP